MTEPTRDQEPSSDPVPDQSPTPGTGSVSGSAPGAFAGVDERPYIKQMPNRRRYDLLLVVPFLCIGASIGTLALSSGIFRHVALLLAFVSLFCWIRAGVVSTRSAHGNWLMGMWAAVVLFLACGLFDRLTA